MNRYCPGCRRTRRFLATDSHGWVCEGCNYQLAQCGEWIASVCRCGARIEGLGASAHAWGVADHEWREHLDPGTCPHCRKPWAVGVHDYCNEGKS